MGWIQLANGYTGTIKGGEFIDQMSNCWLLCSMESRSLEMHKIYEGSIASLFPADPHVTSIC